MYSVNLKLLNILLLLNYSHISTVIIFFMIFNMASEREALLIVHLVNKINSGKLSDLIFLDFNKAFDKVNNVILLHT
jgi:hypothetical protein